MFNRLSIIIFFVFIYLKASALEITSISPVVGTVGTLVTVNGTGFNNITAFTIGGKPAILVSNSGTKLVGMVMPGAVSGKVSLSNAGGTSVSKGNFILIVPTFTYKQQGNKLVGTGNAGPSYQGTSAAISADGNTAVIGGWQDNGNIGAAWIFTRDNAGNWLQQGDKLVGTDPKVGDYQGVSVAISGDGNTVFVGGSGYDGAVWVYARNGNTWSQQGNKLVAVGTKGGPIPTSFVFGWSMGLSADGNTAVIEMAGDQGGKGAAFVFVRNGNTWTQQGDKLTAPEAIIAIPGLTGNQHVAISADGNTFAMSADTDGPDYNGTWIFTRDNGIWTQQGGKLFGTGSVSIPGQGLALGLSADGNTLAIGGPFDQTGAVWIFTRSGGVWTQQGEKLVGNGVTGNSFFGYALSISADGNILCAGALNDNNEAGAAWIFIRKNGIWVQNGQKMIGTGAIGNAAQGYSVGLSADGTTIAEAGIHNNGDIGATWIFNTTLALASPTVTTLPAAAITSKSATINGSVDDNGNLTTVVFEFSTSPDMSNSTIVQPGPGITSIAPGTGLEDFNDFMNNLAPGTTYYFRIVGATNAGRTDGQILSFTTLTDTSNPGNGPTDIKIPNTFTPNNDGINDKWDLPFLAGYPNCIVMIFNRYGEKVYTCTGVYTPWDGRYKSKEMPTGTYYYLIKTDQDSVPLSGWLTLIR